MDDVKSTTRPRRWDEPFECLAPAVVEELFEAFDKLRHELTIVIFEHNLDLALALADHACVFAHPVDNSVRGAQIRHSTITEGGDP